MMSFFRPLCLCSAVFLCSAVTLADPLAGKVLSSDDKPVSGALVIVQQGESGIPGMFPSDNGPTTGSMLAAKSDLTDADGRFEFELPPGNYHVLAQRWPNPEKPWTTTILFDDATHYGRQVEVLGTAKNVAVPSPEASNLELTPPGTGSAKVTFETGNDDALLVISKAPLAVDPVFRFAGWPGDFLTSAVAFNRPVLGQSEFTGLPSGKLYAGVFGNDNNPGYGMAELVVPDGGTTSVEIEWVAGWSNARKTPPAHLMPLYNKFKENDWLKQKPAFIEDLRAIGQAERNPLKMQELLLAARDKTITLPDGSTATLLDIATVFAYLRLNQ